MKLKVDDLQDAVARLNEDAATSRQRVIAKNLEAKALKLTWSDLTEQAKNLSENAVAPVLERHARGALLLAVSRNVEAAKQALDDAEEEESSAEEEADILSQSATQAARSLDQAVNEPNDVRLL